MPQRKKSRLRTKKNNFAPYHRQRALQNATKRQLHNAALQYGCSVSSLENCSVMLTRLPMNLDSQYQLLHTEERTILMKRPRVLSLFDGISCGLVALKELGIIPESYFSSEIDEHCKAIQRFNFPGEISQIGDICALDSRKLQEIGPIDLLFGGSPCNHFSGANPARKGLNDETGSGTLFYQFLRVHLYFQCLATLQNRTENYKWFFENVCSMCNETRDEISRYLGCNPIKLCASQWTGMKRERYFWTNIVTDKSAIKALTTDVAVHEHDLQTSLCGEGRVAQITTLPTFTSNLTNLCKGGLLPVHDQHHGLCYPYYSEVEKLMGLPLHYTCGPNTPLHKRKQMLAKAWDVHTIKKLLQSIVKSFEIKGHCY